MRQDAARDAALQRSSVAYTATDHDTWRRLYARQQDCRRNLAHPLFTRGLDALGIGGDGIPDLEAVNARLRRLTGWSGVAVKGLEGPVSFFGALARREFPIGNFIRDARDINYTPAPDVFHDLYGHMPFFVDARYGAYCEAFGKAALEFGSKPEALRQFERVFWFGVEFPLVETPVGRRIFGGGILSSYGESIYSLSSEPETVPFDWEDMRRREYRIDEMQRYLYVLDEPEQLYESLGPFVAAVRREYRG